MQEPFWLFSRFSLRRGCRKEIRLSAEILSYAVYRWLFIEGALCETEDPA